MRGKFAVFAEL